MDKEIYKVIIAGGREFSDYELLKKKCNYFLQKKKDTHRVIIVSGTASGADSLGERYAQEEGLSIERYPANWNKYGKSAGYKRNVQMANASDTLIAFWDGKSRGTEHMINIAKERNLNVRIVRYEE
jgi:hypothetical protein